MNNYSRVSINDLTEARLDANYYAPRFLKNEKTLAHCGISRSKVVSIADLCNCGATPVDVVYTNDGLGLVRTSDVRPNYYKTEGILKTNDLTLSLLRESVIARSGDVLYTMSGTIGYACVIPEGESPVSFSNTIARVRLPKQCSNDAHYIAVFFNCHYGYEQSLRLVSGGIQGHVMPNPFKELLIALPNSVVQKYIGDKVRQAERLRAWATILEQRVNTLFQADFKWDYSVLKVSPFNRVRADELENRLDLKFNSPHRLAAIRHAKSVNANLVQLDQIVEISAMIGWKGLTTEHYTSSGPWLLRGVEFSKGVIRTEDLVCVDEDKYLEQPQIHLSEGDIALTKDGTIGKAVVIPRLPNRIAAGSTVARLRKKSTANIDPYYLEFVLAHEFVQCQIESFATGVAQPHITQEWIALLKIPRVTSEDLIAETWKTHHDCLNVAKQLTTAAKHLVEALIEGQLSETELIAAEQALQSGNDQLDRRILNRLKTDGVDGQSQALFSDLDQLYSLLEQASHS